MLYAIYAAIYAAIDRLMSNRRSEKQNVYNTKDHKIVVDTISNKSV